MASPHFDPNDYVRFKRTPSQSTSKIFPRDQPLHRDGTQLIQTWHYLSIACLYHVRYNFFTISQNRPHISRTWRRHYPVYYVLPLHAHQQSRGRTIIKKKGDLTHDTYPQPRISIASIKSVIQNNLRLMLREVFKLYTLRLV